MVHNPSIDKSISCFVWFKLNRIETTMKLPESLPIFSLGGAKASWKAKTRWQAKKHWKLYMPWQKKGKRTKDSGKAAVVLGSSRSLVSSCDGRVSDLHRWNMTEICESWISQCWVFKSMNIQEMPNILDWIYQNHNTPIIYIYNIILN